MMVRSTTSALAAGAALAALTLGGTSVAWAQTEQDVSCEDATAVAANAQVAVDAETGELANLRAALDLALAANEDEQENTPAEDQAITDAQAAVETGETELADAQARLETALEVKTQACEPNDADPGTEPEPPAENLYDDCAEVTAAGAAPLYASDEGYRPELDSDSDGVACEIPEQIGSGSFEFDAGDFGQTDADDVPVGAADTGGL